MQDEVVIRVIVTVVAMILSLTVHEWAHAFAAKRLGDNTAEREGRLTLNPLSHIDPIGTVVFPALGAALGGFLFGWAKPVPFRPGAFRRDISVRTGIFWVSAAGPLSNLVLAVVCAAGLKLLLVTAGAGALATGSLSGLTMLLQAGLGLNVVLALFNLLPVPPLDGHKILSSVIGPSHPAVLFVEQNQFWMFILVLFLGFRLLGPPILLLTTAIMKAVGLG
jgi:Zn-dependent protease